MPTIAGEFENLRKELMLRVNYIALATGGKRSPVRWSIGTEHELVINDRPGSKKMKSFVNWTLTMAAMAAILGCLSKSSTAFAAGGSMAGGGGKGVVCRNSAGKIQSVELLDFWEAKALFSRKIQYSKTRVATQVDVALNRAGEIALTVKPAEMEYIREVSRLFLNEGQNPAVKFTRLRGASLNETDDSYELARPDACGVEQIVIYRQWSTGEEILINQDLYDKLDLTNQAALIVHESLYAALRRFEMESNSIRVRRAVGYLFAGGTFPKLDSLLPNRYIECESTLKYPTGYVMTSVALFESLAGDPGMSAVVKNASGQQPLAYFPAVVINHNSLHEVDELLTNPQHCESLTEGENETIFLGQTGPLAFDRSYGLTVTCRNSRVDIRFEPFANAKGHTKTLEELQCRWITK
jgi:hypothetical protein